MANVPNEVLMPLDKVWTAEDFHHFIMVVGFATGMIDKDATSELKELYKQSAMMCERFIEKAN